jgi:hypothetical protein
VAQNRVDSDLGPSLEDRAEEAQVSVSWLMEQLGRRSLGLTLFMMAIIALVPGVSIVIGVLIAWPAIQMTLGHEEAVLPRLISRKWTAGEADPYRCAAARRGRAADPATLAHTICDHQAADRRSDVVAGPVADPRRCRSVTSAPRWASCC